jgi:hypothetical protein
MRFMIVYNMLNILDYFLAYPHLICYRPVTDLEILIVLVTRLLRQDLDRLVNGMEPVEL